MAPSGCLSPLRGHGRQALTHPHAYLTGKGADSHTPSDLLKASLRARQCQGHSKAHALYSSQRSMASSAGHKDQASPLHPNQTPKRCERRASLGQGSWQTALLMGPLGWERTTSWVPAAQGRETRAL